MLELLTAIDQLELSRDGTIRVRMRKIVLRKGVVILSECHRTAVEPGVEMETIVASVNAHLKSMQAIAPERGEWDKLGSWIGRFHTHTTVKAFAVRRKAILARRQEVGLVDIAPLPIENDEDGATVFQLIGVSYVTPACPAGRIDRLVMASPVIIMAGNKPIPLPQFNVLPGVDTLHALRDYVKKFLPNGKSDDIDNLAKDGASLLFDAFGAQLVDLREWGRLNSVVEHEHTPDIKKSNHSKTGIST